MIVLYTKGSVTRDTFYIKEIKMRIVMAKDVFSRKYHSWQTCKHLIQQEICQVLYLEQCTVWLRDVGTKKIEAQLSGEFGNAMLDENNEN